MLIKSLQKGEIKVNVRTKIEQVTKLSENLLRINLSDESGSINLIITGSKLVQRYSCMKVKCELRISNFTISDSVENIQA